MMINKIKTSLRIKSNSEDLNTEITDLIEACKTDLLISGIKKIVDTDPLIQQAIKLYCKANFGLDNKDSDRYKLSYESLKQSLALCGDYNVE